MTLVDPTLSGLAAQLAAGPRFLLLGEDADEGIGAVVAGQRWNGVYTSASTRAVTRAFDTELRTTAAHGPSGRTPTRSAAELEVRYLFGGAHLDDSERMAVTALSRAAARIGGIQELSRLVNETITPRGTLLIDQWTPADRLVAFDAIPILASLGPAQAHLFSAGVWAGDPTVAELAEGGQLVLHPGTLDETLQELIEAGALGGEEPDSRHVIPLGTGFVGVDVHTWNEVRRSARPVDLDLLTPSTFSSDAARYQQFRAFAGAVDGAPRWRGIADGMNLRRDFERDVLDEIRRRVDNRDLPLPIVIEGQTASGKSIAMVSLAAELARDGQVAVLHQARRTVRPSLTDIDGYAAWAEHHGARATVLFWDGMCSPSDYEALSRQLRARGRRVVVVGSAYLRQDADSSRVIVAPAQLSDDESGRLITLLRGFGVPISKPAGAVDATFLAFLYRVLPETIYQLRNGLALEMRAAERGMEQLVRAKDAAPASGYERLTALQQAFLAAGVDLLDLLSSDTTDGSPIGETSFADRGPLQRMTTLVLVAGRHGIPVPIDLVLRILGRAGSESIRVALDSSDIIQEIDDDNGELFLSSRSHLEAELLAQHEIPLPTEVEVLVDVIRRVRVQNGFGWGTDEVQFLVSLLERIGPSSDQSQYKRYFSTIADALSERRLETGQAQPRLALQESVFARGAVHWEQGAKRGTTTTRVAALERNQEMLIDVLADERTRGLLRLSLTVELASTLGAIVYEGAHDATAATAAGLTERLDDILAAVLQARAIDPGNIYPVDVLAWTTRDAIKAGTLSPEERLDRLASAVATISSLDRGALSPAQRANLDRRGAELNDLLGRDDAVWEYMKSLERNADPAATYFLARFDADSGPAGMTAALTRLRSAPAGIRRDWRCAQLLVELTWTSITGQKLLRGERVAVHISSEQASQIRALAAELEAADLPDAYKLKFALGIADFADERFADAARGFREVDELTRHQSKRIRTAYVLADAKGSPQVFTGRVEAADPRSGEVWVDQLGTRVRFEPRLFSAGGEVERDQQLPAFVIGFKLSRGAVAEPRNIVRPGATR